MKKVTAFIIIIFTVFSCNMDEPKQFSEAAFSDSFINLQGNSVAFKDILESHVGKTIVIDIWASWCSDCITGMPKVKTLQNTYKDVVYVFLSLDRTQDAWKKGIKKYQVNGEHYFMPSGQDSPFAEFVNISWIPRYMVINKAGEIVIFNVIEANDNKLIEALKK